MEKAEKQRKKWGFVNFLALIVCCVMFLVGAGAIWTVGQRIPEVGEHIVNVANHTVSDVIIFLDNLFLVIRILWLSVVTEYLSVFCEENKL